MKLLHAAPLALLALAATGCGALYAQGEIQQVCITLPPQTIPITPLAGTSGTFSQAVNFSLGDAIPDFILKGDSGERTLQLTLLQISLPPGQAPGANVNWLSSAQLVVVPPPGSPLPSQSLARYTRGAASLPITQITVQPAGDTNLTDYFALSQLDLRLTGNVDFGATLPTSETLLLEACFYAKVRVTVQQMIDAGK
jgi:hypothetical protein